jgi:hypothetical protein
MSHEHAQDDLVALALDELDGPHRERVLRELGGCHECRQVYEELEAAVAEVLTAAPSVEPPAGFEARALAALGVSGRRPRTLALVAASCAVGLLLGATGTYLVAQRTSEPSERTEVATQDVDAVLRTAGGETVGTVTATYLGKRPVYVMTVRSAAVGMHYVCRIELRDGRTVDAADWVTRSSSATWVVDRGPADPVELTLVTDNGAGPVWSRARL